MFNRQAVRLRRYVLVQATYPAWFTQPNLVLCVHGEGR